jgi:hypothetical protein
MIIRESIMKKMTTYLPHINDNLKVLLLAMCLLLISACSQESKDESTSVSVSLPAEIIAQMKADPTSVGGDLNGITKVIISVFFDNNRDGAAIASGDILAAGGNLRLSVIPNTGLYITGTAYDASGVEQFFGETTVAALGTGSNVPVNLTLTPVGALLKPVSGTITTAGALGTIAQGTVVQVLQVVGGTEEVISEGTVTDANGAYTLDVPQDINPGSDIIFRVLVGEDGTTAPMDARYTSPEVININPATHAASQLVGDLVRFAETDLSAVSVGEIVEIERTLNLIAIDLGPRTDLNFQDYANLLSDTLTADLETAHIASSAVAGGQICGNVADESENNLEGITIIVREFDSRLLRARTQTDVNGNYCVNVATGGENDLLTGTSAPGEYIIGAINRTTDSFAASQWWSSPGGVPLRIEAGKVSLLETNSATADFILPAGARIQGNVSAESTTESLAGVNVMVRDKTTQYLLVGALSDPNGDYVLNVPVGEYIIEARNNTSKPYASETFTSDGAGSHIRNFGSVVTPTIDPPFTANFTLASGNLLTGKVTEPDPITENPVAVTGILMFVDDANGGASTRTLVSKIDGSYQVWLRPGSYNVYGYGQSAPADLTRDPTLAQPAESIAFEQPVAKLPVVIQHNGTSVSKAKIRLLFESEGPLFRSLGFSKSDGTAMLYSDIDGIHLIDARIEGQESYSSIVYQDKLILGDGDPVTLTTGQTAQGVTITSQNAGWLTGSVFDVDGNPVGNAVVSVFPDLFPGGYSRLTFTRTSSDGRFEISLPQGTYNNIRVSADFGVADCQSVPVVVSDTTELLIEDSGDGIFCNYSQTPPTLRSLTGSVTLNGLDTVFSDALVQLIEIDASGNQVGDVVSFGIVQNDTFTLSIPDTLPAESRYIARVQTASGTFLQAHLTNLDSVDLSPVSTVASELVLTYSNVTDVNAAEIVEIERSLQDVALANDLSGATTLADYISQIKTAFLSDLKTANILTSSFGLGTICGQVQDSNNTALQDITIEVRDFSNQTLRARTTSDSTGNYCVNVPIANSQDPVSLQTSNGEYIVGAINHDDTNFAASEWWTATGDGYLRISGEKISVQSETTITADFTLEPGAQIFGHIGAMNAAGGLIDVPGVKVSVLDSTTHLPLAEQLVQSGGTFSMDVFPGDYIVEVRNNTFRQYASAVFTTPSGPGTNLRNVGAVLSVASGDSAEATFVLSDVANQLSGRVAVGADPTTGLGGDPVTGIKVNVYQSVYPSVSGVLLNGPPVTKTQVTNLDGQYQIWLAPDVYEVYAYGQYAYANMVQLPSNLIFPDSVSTLPVTVLYNSDPVSRARVRIYAQTEGYEFWGESFSRSDGTATLYSNFNGSHVVQARIEEDAPYASIYYGGTQQFDTATRVSLSPDVPTPPITIDLPNGGILTGIIDDFGNTAMSNTLVAMVLNNDYFVATRTDGNGRFRLSLPEGVYEPEFHFTTYTDGCIDATAGVPVFLNETTTMDATTGDGTFCTLTLTPQTITVGSITFDRTISHDTYQHSLRIPTLSDWSMNGYNVADGSFTADTRAYSFSKQIKNGVPVTISTDTINGANPEIYGLAVATDGAMYIISAEDALGNEIILDEPVLFLPASLTLNTPPWPSFDGGTNSVVEEGVQSPAGYTGTIHIRTTYTDQTIPPWNTYIRVFDGVVDEWEEDTTPLYYRRTDINPENPPVVGAGAVP